VGKVNKFEVQPLEFLDLNSWCVTHIFMSHRK
jgi:hypothetical protein